MYVEVLLNRLTFTTKILSAIDLMGTGRVTLGKDLGASVVVFLVALPLCLGIALASGAPLFSGIIAGIAGGIITGVISGSQISVSGPAAGLTVIVAASITSLANFEYFLVAVVLAGFFQLIFGLLKGGIVGNIFPNSVIKGMLAAIGILLILKQLPHAMGYDKDLEGDEEFLQPDGHNTLSEFLYVFDEFTIGCIVISVATAFVLVLWETKPFKKSIFKLLPGPLIAVLVGTMISVLFKYYQSPLQLESQHLVSLPISKSFTAFYGNLIFPDFTGGLKNGSVWMIALTISIVASLESLLSIEATDKIDPQRRISPLNRELFAQGAGNIASGLLGGLPITAVIVRSSANIVAGGQTKVSAIAHGFLLLFSVLFIPELLNYIPLSTLAVILIFTGFKLIKPSIFREVFSKGYDSFIPFMVTLLAIVFSDLLKGVALGMAVGIFFVLRNNVKIAVMITSDGNNHYLRFIKDVTFFNKNHLRNFFRTLPRDSFLIIDMTRPVFVDDDIFDLIDEFVLTAKSMNIKIEIKQDSHNNFNKNRQGKLHHL